MARYTGASCKLCRREGKKLFLKGDRCLSDKCAIARRATVPGQHGAGRKTVKEYGLQLREKQTARRYYGVQEKQFLNYYVQADKKEGVTGENLLQLLELRLDNIVYRMGLASSRKEARQRVRHAHFTLNGKKADIPSMQVKAGDVIAVKEKSTSSPKFKEIKEMTISTPEWVSIDTQKLEGKVLAMPTRSQIDTPVTEHLIVELYSK